MSDFGESVVSGLNQAVEYSKMDKMGSLSDDIFFMAGDLSRLAWKTCPADKLLYNKFHRQLEIIENATLEIDELLRELRNGLYMVT